MNAKGTATLTSRRHRPGAAAVAFTHALSLTNDPLIAASIASAALRRGAHSRLSVIAHARHQAIEHARNTPMVATQADAATDVANLAGQLAATRPPVERAIVDLELRYGLDTASFGRVLGLTNNRATERSNAVADSWARELDPAVMAWLGPGSCPEMTTILIEQKLWPRAATAPVVASVDSTGPIPIVGRAADDPTATDSVASSPIDSIKVEALLTCAPAISEHADHCTICGDRLRQLTPVRAIVGQRPIESVPPAVAEAARTSHRRIPTPLPPSIEPHRIDISRLRTPSYAAIGLVVCIGLGISIVKAHGGNAPSQNERVQKLIQSNPSNLLATPTIVTQSTGTAALANTSNNVISWSAVSDVEWIIVQPANGELPPAKTVSLAITSHEPSDVHTDATITVTGNDGSRQTLRYRSTH